jgi:hypothetical protein
LDDGVDETALNAAAAREVAREMDNLNFSPPYPPPRLAISEPQPMDKFSTPPSPFSRRRDSVQPPRNSGDSTAPPYSPIPVTTEPPPTAIPAASLPSTYLPQQSQQPSSPTSLIPRTTSPPPSALPAGPVPSSYLPRFPDGATPYGTTPYGARSPTDTPMFGSSVSLTSLNKSAVSPGPLPPPGHRTISAAAFRRPLPRTTADSAPPSPLMSQPGPADTTPLHVRKRNEQQHVAAPSISTSTTRSGFSTASTTPSLGQFPSPPHEQPQEEESFDYISAYLGSNGEDARNKEDFR